MSNFQRAPETGVPSRVPSLCKVLFATLFEYERAENLVLLASKGNKNNGKDT